MRKIKIKVPYEENCSVSVKGCILAFQARGPGSIPGRSTIINNINNISSGDYSPLPYWRNWIAHSPSKREVVGSSPTWGT